MAKRIVKYNPAFLSKEELVSSFVVRHAELELIVQVLRENVTESNQHVLVIGPRGIGKTMLVLRVVEEIRNEKNLRERWYPLVFSEESYPVTTPGEFWLEALFHLGEQTGDDRWKQTYHELGNEKDEGRLREKSLAQLMDFADAKGKRIILVVENFNMLVGEQMHEDDGWTLRHTLLHEPRIMLLATATSRFEQIDNCGKAMFELFRTLDLKPLDERECRTLWSCVTGEELSDERIRPLQILTGGSPRLVAIISMFASRMSLRELMDDLMQLVDDHTEYFKGYLDRLPAVERKTFLALADLWDPATAREVADAARLGVSKASALLRRLMERGAVVLANGQKRTKLYQVAERMYNIYYLMRRRGAPSRRVKAVVNFMVSFYGQEELVGATQRIAEEACGLEPELRVSHYVAYEAMLEKVSARPLREKLLEVTPHSFFEAPDIPLSLKGLLERAATTEEEAGPGREEVLRLIDKGDSLSEKPDKAKEAESIYRKIINADPTNAGVWARLGCLLEEKLERYEEAEEAYCKAVELKPDYAWGWANLGSLLHRHLGKYEEAEKAYRKALEIEDKFAWAWAQLGQLLHEKLERYDEAEKAYRKVIEIYENPAWGWAHLGWLLHGKLERYEEAEKAYRKAIEINEKSAWAWAHLGWLLHEKLENYEEAEKAYRKAIEIDEKYAWSWAYLGLLLHEKLERYEEAEQAYRKVLELEPDDFVILINFFSLLLDKMGQTRAAVSLAEEFLEKHPENKIMLNNCAWTLHKHGGRDMLSKAEEWARRAAKIAPDDANIRGTLASVLCVSGKVPEALENARIYIEDTKIVEETVDDAIDLFVGLAAAGYEREALKILAESPSAEILEPLVVGLRMYVGEDVKAAAEIMEVGRDVVKRIEERREKMQSKGASENRSVKK